MKRFKEVNIATKIFRFITCPFIFIIGLATSFSLHTIFPIAWILELSALGMFLGYCLSYPFIKFGVDIPIQEPIFNETENLLLNHFISMFMFILMPFYITYVFVQTGVFDLLD